MYHHVTIIDDFYDEPHAVRRKALDLEYRRKGGATYPGKEAISGDFDWEKPWGRLRAYIHEEVEPLGPKVPPFPQGKFRVAQAKDHSIRTDGVHVDEQPWSGVVYLSEPKDCQGQPAVCFYKHIETGLTFGNEEWWAYMSLKLEFGYISPEERTDRFWAYMREPEHWQEIDRTQNRFNRALLLNAKQFHASSGLFGESRASGRLTQHFEFYNA